jgi:transposase
MHECRARWCDRKHSDDALAPATFDSNSSRVTIDATKLPRDRAALRAMLLAEIARRERAEDRATVASQHAMAEAARADALARESRALVIVRAELETRIAQLESMLAAMRRHRFGARSETQDPEQLALAFEAIEQQIAAIKAQLEPQPDQPPRARPQRAANRGNLPKDLPRVEKLVDLADKSCPCCRREMVCIGEDRAERLDVVPAQLRVEVTIRPKYTCRSCDAAPVQAPAPGHIVEGGLPTDALVAQVVVAKYADHCPLYRQTGIFARQGVDLDRSTLADWVGRAAWHLTPLYEALRADLMSSAVLFADETTLPVLDPGRGRTKTGQLWSYARDMRGWGGGDPPGVAYVYEPDRAHRRPLAHLQAFSGVLHCDGYEAYARIAENRPVRLALCWVHVRRRFFEIAAQGPAPIAEEMLRRIAALYAIEAEIRGRSAETRLAERRAHALPIVTAMEPWLREQLEILPGKLDTARAIRYALKNWTALCTFLEDGRIELDTNTVERAIKPQVLTRKNALFAGSDGGAEHWACIASLLQTCKLNDVDPQAWLTDTLSRIAAGHKIGAIAELLPWAWKARQGVA